MKNYKNHKPGNNTFIKIMFLWMWNSVLYSVLLSNVSDFTLLQPVYNVTEISYFKFFTTYIILVVSVRH